MDDGRATVFVGFHRQGDAEEFAEFAALLAADAATAPGFRWWLPSVLASPLHEWAIALNFSDPEGMHAWLDRTSDLLAGHEYRTRGVEVFVDDVPSSAGVLLVHEQALPGHEEDFLDSAQHLATLEQGQPGYEGSSLFAPSAEHPSWTSVIRFRTGRHLDAWLASPALADALPQHRAHLARDAKTTTATSFGATVRVSDGEARVTPGWKTAMLVLLVLYPAVMLLGRFVNPLLDAVLPGPWLTVFASMAISIALLTWALMPLAVRALGRWLDPVEGAVPRVSALGTLAVIAGYAVFLGIFAALHLLRL